MGIARRESRSAYLEESRLSSKRKDLNLSGGKKKRRGTQGEGGSRNAGAACPSTAAPFILQLPCLFQMPVESR